MNTKDRVTRRLVDWHFRIEPGLREVYRFLSNNEEAPDEPIKLLEVSKDTFATGKIDTFTFAPSGDITFPSTIATVTPEEMEQIRQGQIPLPSGWSLLQSQLVRRKHRQRQISMQSSKRRVQK